MCGVKLIHIYQCLCDETRLRILHLLVRGPLCVCHFQTVLGEPQVKISKHLNYLKSRGLVESLRHENWRVYKLPDSRGYELEKHLKCLQDCIQETNLFREDLRRLKAVKAEAAEIAAECCGPQGKDKECCHLSATKTT
jgi:ArsR family transcriptional regulator, arsenate/arsenite/antimonite-responsive transcriptional repressor